MKNIPTKLKTADFCASNASEVLEHLQTLAGGNFFDSFSATQHSEGKTRIATHPSPHR